MAFEIILAPTAATALKNLSVPIRTGVTKALELHLTHEPTKVSKSRIKRLRGLTQPQYRLRVGDIRVFYDVTESQVQVLAIVTKAEAQSWLDQEGTPTQGSKRSGSGGSEGWPFQIPPARGRRGNRHHAARSPRWHPDRIWVGRRLVRLSARASSGFSASHRGCANGYSRWSGNPASRLAVTRLTGAVPDAARRGWAPVR